MAYRYELSKASQSYLRRLSPDLRNRIIAKIRLICRDPFDTNQSKPLHGSQRNRRSGRAGDYRIIVEVIEEDVVVLIVRVGPRGDVYKD